MIGRTSWPRSRAIATRASSIVNMPTNRPPLTIGRRRIACELGSTEVFDLTRVDAALLLEEAVVSCRDRGVLRWRVDS